MSKAQFNQIVKAQQEIQKRNPYGSAEHRKAYDALRKAVKAFTGNDIGDYAE